MRRNATPAGELIERGWLPLRAACAALDMSPRDIKRRVQDGIMERREIAPGHWLYCVPSEAA